MKNLINRIKHWFWWKFKATDKQKCEWQMITLGTGIMKGDKFIDVKDMYL